ncbi:tripartite tricarboxylate transporter permease [soil metagenome]
MDLIHNLVLGAGQVFQAGPLIAIVVGTIIGIGVGVLPGLSASTGIALVLPFSFFLGPTTGLILMCALYTAAEYGGAIPAIAVNTPGEPSSMCTALDGYPLAKMGRMKDALWVSLVTSAVGGLIGTFALILFAPGLARFALSFGAAEYVALGFLGLSLAASLSSKNYVKGAVTTLLGLLLATFGQDPLTGSIRFSFGLPEMVEGFNLVPALIGLFAASEVFSELFAAATPEGRIPVEQSKRRMPFSELWALKRATVVGSLLGTIIGVIPGGGATIASLISYSEAKRVSKQPELFGKGSLEGVAASESANNSCVGGALVPTLTLGIPGSGSTAVMLGAFSMYGLHPGPELFRTDTALVYGLFVALIVANFSMLLFGAMGVSVWLYFMRLPKPALMTLVMATCVVGAFAEQNSMWDVGVMLSFGMVGYILKRYDYPVSTVVIGLVLGFMMETNLRRAVLLGGWESFVTRPLAAILLLVAFTTLGYVAVREFKGRKRIQSAGITGTH